MKTNTQNIARKIFFLFSFFYFLNTNAQAPDKMSYQAVVRNNSNTLVSNANVGIKISILQGTATGTEVYSQTQTATTNDNGLVSLTIGEGGFVSGDFVAINWGNGPYFIKTETDPTGGTSYTITSTTQLMSVPYALYAKTAGASNSWGLSGNAGTTAANFIGTTDDKELLFKVNNEKAGVIEFDDNTQNTVKNANTAFGYQSLNSNTTGYYNTAFGYQSLYSNTTGIHNTAIGQNTLFSNTEGDFNEAIGQKCLYSNTTGSKNSANGYKALFSNTTGNNNLANGYHALYSNTTGYSNVANGYQSLYSNTTGYANVANGYQSLNSNTTGNHNTTNGYRSLYSNVTGNSNVAIGAYAGENIGNNSNGNLFLGSSTGTTINDTNLTNATAIGNKATVGQDNSIILGAVNGINGATADTKVGIGVTAPLTSLDVNGQILTRDRIVLGQTGPTANPITSPIWAMDNSNNNFRIFNQPNISSSGNTYLSIAPSGNTTLNGYTKLGNDAPAIKMKYITGTTGATQGDQITLGSGLPSNTQIIGLSAHVQIDSGTWLQPGFASTSGWNGYEYYVFFYNQTILLKNSPNNSNQILSKPFKILITYIE
jgi:hypothetical protein